jgi:hypothetical protein
LSKIVASLVDNRVIEESTF